MLCASAATYAQSGAQIVAPTVYDYGAACDGTTDDTAAIQKAINSLPNGGTLGFPAATCKITSTLTINNISNLALIGTGASTIQAATAGWDMLTITGSSANITIEGMRFIGAATAPVSPQGFHAVAVSATATGSRLMFRHNYVTGTNIGVAIHSPTFDECDISGNKFDSMVGSISGNGYAVYTISERNSITHNKFYDIGRHDLYLSGDDATHSAAKNVFADNQSYGNGVESVAMYATPLQRSVQGNIIKANTIDSPQGIGIGCDQNCIGNVIEGNTILNATAGFGSGEGVIELNGSTAANSYPTSNVIRGNVILNATGNAPGIWSQNGFRNVIEGNTINATGPTWGILIASTGGVTPTGAQIIGNNISGPATSLQGDTSLLNTAWANNIIDGPTYNVCEAGSYSGSCLSNTPTQAEFRGTTVIASGLQNSASRPAAGPGFLSQGEISGVGYGTGTLPDSADDGFIRIGAGGGVSAAHKTYCDFSGYSTVADMSDNIVCGTKGAEALRITNLQHLLIGTTTDDGSSLLQVHGNIHLLTGAFEFPDGTTQTTAANATSIAGGTGISVSTSGGVATISNTGVVATSGSVTCSGAQRVQTVTISSAGVLSGTCN